MSEVCYGTEPCLQAVTGKQKKHKSANREGGARLDIVVVNLGERQLTHIFDVRIFNPFAQGHLNTSLPQCYRKQEVKKRAYEKRVREVAHVLFSPLIFTTAGGIGTIATVVYKRLASCIAEKHNRKTLH